MKTVKEILRAHAFGRIDREELIQRLVHFDYAKPSRYNRSLANNLDEYATEDDVYGEPDTWDEVRRASWTGLLDGNTYMEIVKGLAVKPNIPQPFP